MQKVFMGRCGRSIDVLYEMLQILVVEWNHLYLSSIPVWARLVALLFDGKLSSNFHCIWQKSLNLIVNPYALLEMTALMPLQEIVDLMVTFIQKRDVYICDFVAALNIIKGQLYTLYVDKATTFATNEFWAFKNILDYSHSQIYMKWVSDLNYESAQLVFVANGSQI